ncbi:MAG TPA: DUF4410 domain-containing protein [Verrucomicrobiae bacterium]|nr:DUF4410 domain-containing protein [Verrucomicrobiae bacterium]
MKTTNPVRSLTTLTLLAVGLALWPANAADTIEFQRVDKLDKIWLAEGFAFKDYEVLLVTALNAEGIQPKDEKEADRLNLLKRGYAEDMARGLERFAGFPEATSKEADVPAGRKKLVLDTKLLEFSRGSSAARYGLGFGAGMPFIKIRGTFHEGDPAKPLAIFEMDEKGDWMGGGFTSNESLQEKASSELGKDLGRFIEKVRNGEKIKYKKVKKD